MACRNHTPPQCREEVARTHVSAYICSSVSRVVQKFSFSRERLHIKTRGQRKQARQVDASRNVYVGDTSWNTSSTVWMREGVAGWVGLKEDLTGSWTGASRKRKRTIKSCCRLAGLAVWRSSRTNGHVHRALHGRAGEGTDAFSNLGLSQTSHSSMYATGRKQVGKRSASEGKAAGRADYCFLTRDSNARSDPAAVEIQAMWNLCGVCVCVCLCVCVCVEVLGCGMSVTMATGLQLKASEHISAEAGRERERGDGRRRGESGSGGLCHIPAPGGGPPLSDSELPLSCLAFWMLDPFFRVASSRGRPVTPGAIGLRRDGGGGGGGLVEPTLFGIRADSVPAKTAWMSRHWFPDLGQEQKLGDSTTGDSQTDPWSPGL